MSDDVEKLVERVRQRDYDALAEYLLANRRQLFAFIERQLGAALRHKVEVDDIFQELSVEAIRSLEDAGLDQRDPFGWLCQIAERRIIDAHRHYFGAQKRDAAREVPLENSGDETHPALVELLAATMTTATQALSRNQRALRLLAAVETLPEDQREILRLRYQEGLGSKEIAQRIHKTDGAVRVMLTRSLARLQKILGPEDAPR